MQREIGAKRKLVLNKNAQGIAGAAGSGVGFFTCVRVGISRGIFTHEAGLGSASIAHACSGADSPVEQGFWGIFEVFCDTILVCTITALSILASGVPLGASGARLATTAVNQLHTLGGKYALCTMCIGVGQGIAVILERV